MKNHFNHKRQRENNSRYTLIFACCSDSMSGQNSKRSRVETAKTVKAKHKNSLTEKDKTRATILIYHNEAEITECCCGQLINGNHICTKDILSRNLRVKECGFKTDVNIDCIICQKDVKQKEYNAQWAIDKDGYDVCSSCYGKCCFGELPKNCECWISDDERW